MKNVHTRVLHHPLSEVRPWIERAWSNTPDDVFPRDVIPNWRRNPDGMSPSALVPGKTMVGHGPFRFALTQWDGHRWRVDLVNGEGWHGFELEALGERTRITHTLDAKLGLWFEVFVLPLHDWVVESMFDRLEIALRVGVVPTRTERPMSLRTRVLFAGMSYLQRRRRRASSGQSRLRHA